MLPFATPLSHAGNELLGTLFFRPEVAQQAVKNAHGGDALLRCKDVQIRFALRRRWAPFSPLPSASTSRSSTSISPILRLRISPSASIDLAHQPNVAGHGGEDSLFLRLIEQAGNGFPNRADGHGSEIPSL